MNIVFVIYNADVVGAVMSSTRREAEFLAERGHRVILLSNRDPAWSGVEYREVQTPHGWAHRQLDYLANGFSRRLPHGMGALDCRTVIPFVDLGAAAAQLVAALIGEGACDRVVICQHPCFLGLKSLRKQVPIVLVAHGDVFTHPWSSFSLPLMLMYRRAARSAYRNAACVVSVSSALAQRAISTGADAASVCVVPNGIDPSEIGWDASFDTERWPRHGPLKLLFVGRLVAEKAIDVLLRAVAKLPRSEFVVDIVGDGERKNDLMALSRKLKINESVTFHGNRKRSALGSFYRDSDIVCLPSLSEAQPVVTLEAMVAGKPVIASRVGGVPDSVQHDFNGMLVNPNNADELADAIRKLADNAPLRERMGMQARSRLSEFAWPQILLRFESAIHNLRNEQTAVSGEQSHWGS